MPRACIITAMVPGSLGADRRAPGENMTSPGSPGTRLKEARNVLATAWLRLSPPLGLSYRSDFSVTSLAALFSSYSCDRRI